VTGYGVVEGEGSRVRCVAAGVIRPKGDSLESRLAEIHRGIQSLLAEYQPDWAAFEAVFASRNLRSALVLGQARGAALAACGVSSLQVAEYTPAEVKTAVVGNGRAAKEQVQHMVQLLLGLHQRPVPDAADALAVGICHLQQAPMRAAIARAERAGQASRGAIQGGARRRAGPRGWR